MQSLTKKTYSAEEILTFFKLSVYSPKEYQCTFKHRKSCHLIAKWSKMAGLLIFMAGLLIFCVPLLHNE